MVMQPVEQAEPAGPTPEIMLIGASLFALGKGDPKRIKRLIGTMRRVLEVRRASCSVVRIRAAREEAAEGRAIGQALAWLDRVGPLMEHLATMERP